MAAVPSSEQYERALRVLRTAGTISALQRRFLRAHYLAPAYTLTTMELAAVAKYATHHGVNRQYGQFGAHLARQLDWQVPPGGIHASVFATFSEGNPEMPYTRWTLRPEVVEALDKLQWFPRGRSSL